ncbi:MAG TPA: helical backbone metal receptor [Planctomycetota bacterium]|nr:helical backbone metal receptor [Planctomycetota bacterium]
MHPAPKRLVSLVPSTTESVCVLGAASSLVGCTRYCIEPAPQLAGVVRVGGTKNPSCETIVRLAPDLVLANAEENRAEHIEWLGRRVPVLVQTPRTVVEAASDLRTLAERLDLLEAALPILLRIEAELAAASVAEAERAPLRVFYAIWPRPWMGVNHDTFLHDVLRIAGADNVCAGFAARYPEVSEEFLRAQEPDAVLLPSEPWPFGPADRATLARSGVFGRAALELCDGRDYCWHGVRMAFGLGRARQLVARLRRPGRDASSDR